MIQCKSSQTVHIGFIKNASVYVLSFFFYFIACLTLSLQQWLKSANTCPVCRGSVSETRPLGSRRSARTRSIFSGSLRRHAHGQTGPPPPGDNPGVSRFNHSVATENNLRTSRRGARVAQPEQQVPSASSASAAAVESGSSAPGTSVSANNSRSAGPVPSDSEDEHVEMEFEPHLYRWWR